MRDIDRTMTRSGRGVLAVAACAAALAGCAVGPDYKRPSMTLPEDYKAVTPATTQGGVPVAVDWWRQYNDPILTDLVNAALTNNPNVRLALARVDEARGALRETNSQFFPLVSYSGIGERFRSGVDGSPSGSSSSAASATGTAGTGTGATGTGATGTGSTSSGSNTTATGNIFYGKVFNATASVSYELDLWGRLRRLSESAQAQLLSTTYARDVATLALASTTAQAYFTLRSLDAQVIATNNTMQAVLASLDIARKRLEAGYTSALDYQQAETLRAQTQVTLRDLRRQRSLQEHQLGNLTSNLSLRIEPGKIEDLPVPLTPPPGLPSTLLERRPDVQRDEQSLVSANATIGSTKAELFPTFGLTGSYGGQSLQLSDLLKAPFRFWTLGLDVSGPLFAGGKYLARLDEAKAVGNEQIAVYQTTVEGAFREVADALTNVEESNAAEVDVMTQVESARRTLRLSQLRYQAGYSAYLDVLDATRTANAAEITLVQNRASRLNYSVDLIKALGGGWTAEGAAASPAGPTVPTPNGGVATPTASR